jgi:hypothetical protein
MPKIKCLTDLKLIFGSQLFVIAGLKRIQTNMKKFVISENRMDRMRREDFKGDNQTAICTDNCALMHSFLCILVKGVMLKKENPFEI